MPQVITKISPLGVRFTEDKEGPGRKAYKDPVGIVTIGPGFTRLSKVFDREWKKMRGHTLRMGDTITADEVVRLFEMMSEEEYGPPVVTHIRPEHQHHYDASFDMIWNCGAGAAVWQWAVALRNKLVSRSAALLRTTALTGRGSKKRLPGLVRRRNAEALLIETGDYGLKGQDTWESQDLDEVSEYQTALKKLGYYLGAVDGVKAHSLGAVKDFQKAMGLVVDGKVGPATRSALRRALAAKKTVDVGTGTGLGTGAVGLPAAGLDNWLYVGLAVAGVIIAVGVGYWLWSHRGLFTKQREPA